MKKTKSNVCKIVAGITAVLAATIVSLKANPTDPNCHLEYGGFAFECYGDSSECDFNLGGEHTVCKGSKIAVFHIIDPE